MAAYILWRIVRIVVIVWAAATFVFIMIRLAGDPMAALVPGDMPQAVIDTYRARYGLDRPLGAQYLAYLRQLLGGDMGFSFRTQGPAWDLVRERIPATLLLTGTSLGIAVVLGIAAGIVAAVNRNRWPDRVLMGLAVLGFATPNFFLRILLILLFTLRLGWLPPGGFSGPASLLMPALTLGLASMGAYARMTRSALLEVLGAPFMETARAKGLRPARRLFVHGMRASLLPLITLLGFSIGSLIAGAIVAESVFSWPGIGQLLAISVAERDLAVVQLIVILSAATMAVSNAAVDLLLGIVDPRIGSSRAAR